MTIGEAQFILNTLRDYLTCIVGNAIKSIGLLDNSKMTHVSIDQTVSSFSAFNNDRIFDNSHLKFIRIYGYMPKRERHDIFDVEQREEIEFENALRTQIAIDAIDQTLRLKFGLAIDTNDVDTSDNELWMIPITPFRSVW